MSSSESVSPANRAMAQEAGCYSQCHFFCMIHGDATHRNAEAPNIEEALRSLPYVKASVAAELANKVVEKDIQLVDFESAANFLIHA